MATELSFAQFAALVTAEVRAYTARTGLEPTVLIVNYDLEYVLYSDPLYPAGGIFYKDAAGRPCFRGMRVAMTPNIDGFCLGHTTPLDKHG